VAGNEHSVSLGASNRVYIFGSNSHGQLGIGEKSYVTPIKSSNLPTKNLAVSIPLHSIKEVSMDNSTLLRKTDEVSSLKEYIWDLDYKVRESESNKEYLMSETLKFTSKIEKMAAGLQRSSHSAFGQYQMDTPIDEVVSYK
jgi:hypothetical protein